MIVTCPACQTRYRADAAALARPGGRSVRCAACGHLWRHPPVAAEDEPPMPPAFAALRLEPTIELSPRPEPAAAPPPRRRYWQTLGLPVFVVLVVIAVVAALYFYHWGGSGP